MTQLSVFTCRTPLCKHGLKKTSKSCSFQAFRRYGTGTRLIEMNCTEIPPVMTTSYSLQFPVSFHFLASQPGHTSPHQPHRHLYKKARCLTRVADQWRRTSAPAAISPSSPRSTSVSPFYLPMQISFIESIKKRNCLRSSLSDSELKRQRGCTTWTVGNKFKIHQFT